MKKKIIIIIVTIALLLSIPGTLLVWGLALPAQYGGAFLGELKHKVRMLEVTPGPRIILVGGSGAAFGVDSALMERELPGYSVVNFGMYAALGTTVMLDLSQPHIREGDIVLLIPEQQEQTLSDWFDPAVMWQGLDGAFDLLRLQPQGIYRRDSFDEKGDISSPLCARNEMPGGFDASTPIRFDTDMVTEAFARRVRDYAEAVKSAGAILWYAPCPMNGAAVENKEDVDGFYASLQERLSIPLAGDPHDFILDAGWFYDTNFHPNSSGKTVYTKALIRAVKAMLGDSSPTDIPLPEMPELARAVSWVGDDSDGACFTYGEVSGTLAVTGLTREGMERTALTVPSVWEGKSVTAIGTSAFSGAENLREITLQLNIGTISDGAFGGCAALERIIIQSAQPSACRVGQRLLEGTSAKIYVPVEALSAYRTDYFWSVYGGSVRPMEA